MERNVQDVQDYFKGNVELLGLFHHIDQWMLVHFPEIGILRNNYGLVFSGINPPIIMMVSKSSYIDSKLLPAELVIQRQIWGRLSAKELVITHDDGAGCYIYEGRISRPEMVDDILSKIFEDFMDQPVLSEKEKMLTGLLYDANSDPTLLAERKAVKRLIYEYNHLHPDREAKQQALIRKIVKRCGERITIEAPFHCDYGYNIEIGEDFYANYNLIILDGAKVTIGDHVFIAPNVGLYTAGHAEDVKQRNQGLEYAYPITIGNNVWIGGGVTVLPGVTIHDNCIIGAGSVVTKDIPANSVAVGNPCRVVRKTNEEEKK